MRANLAQRISDRLTVPVLFVGFSIASLLTMVVTIVSIYSSGTQLPDPGPAPIRPSGAKITHYRYLRSFYRSLVEEDAKKLELRKPRISALARGNEYRVELDEPRRLEFGRSLQTRALRVKATRRKLWVGGEGHRFRMPHIVLRITNRLRVPIAYRVETSVRGARCSRAAVIAHNALALPPRQSVTRSECLWRKGARIALLKASVLQLTPLGYHYVSRLNPEALQFPLRPSRGHHAGRLPLCTVLPWQTLKQILTDRPERWIDVVDFYSRHSCEEYSYFPEYRWSASGPKELPAKPPTISLTTSSR